MTLSFSTKWPDRIGQLAGQPNNFIEKIWNGLIAYSIQYPTDYTHFHQLFKSKFGAEMNEHGKLFEKPKIHTIREDPHNRWKAGMKIHPVINNRTKDRFQFAPVLECTGVQHIRISHRFVPYPPGVWVGDDLMHRLNDEQLYDLARNDGFDSADDFFRYFNTDFKGKLIHWTTKRY